MKIARRLLFVCALAAASAASLFAETGPAPRWGTSTQSVLTVSAWSFEPNDSATTWSYDSTNLQRYSTSAGAFYTGLTLFDGALVSAIELDACDTSASEEVQALLVRSTPAGSQGLALVSTSGTPGCSRFFMELPAAETIDNATYTYSLAAVTGANSSETSFGAVRVLYELQVSPAPPTATFNDVPTSDPGFQYIEALVESGITAGCGGGNYCPDAGLTRRQMAVFLAKALGLNWPEASNLGAGARR